MGYTKQAIFGFGWLTLGKILSTGLTVVKISVTARLLSPHDFGLFSLILVALGLTEAATQTGVNLTILQSDKPIRYYLNSAWIISMVRGAVIACLIALISLSMSWWYQEPKLIGLGLVAALIPLIKGAINPSIVALRKDLRFGQDALYLWSLVLVDVMATIGLVYLWRSPLALVGGLVSAALYEVLMSFVLFEHRPKFVWQAAAGKEILRPSASLAFNAAGTYINDTIDDLLIGTWLGTSQLGLYHTGYALGHKPNYELAKGANYSLQSVLVRLVGDPARLKRAFLRAYLGIAAAAVVATAPLWLAPSWITSLLLGEQWLAIIPVLPWLAGAGVLHTLGSLHWTLLLVVKRYRALNCVVWLSIGLVVISITLGSWWGGLLGAGIGLFLSRLALLPIMAIVTWRR